MNRKDRAIKQPRLFANEMRCIKTKATRQGICLRLKCLMGLITVCLFDPCLIRIPPLHCADRDRGNAYFHDQMGLVCRVELSFNEK